MPSGNAVPPVHRGEGSKGKGGKRFAGQGGLRLLTRNVVSRPVDAERRGKRDFEPGLGMSREETVCEAILMRARRP